MTGDATVSRPSAGDERGFTLIELMISLLLFALIAAAGVTLVDSVLGVQGRTAARLDRLAAVQRTMLVVSGDLEQVAGGDMAGGGNALSFSRAAPGFGGPPIGVRYALDRGILTRQAGGAVQVLLGGVAAARWEFFDQGWVGRWPLAEDRAGDWPRAVALELTLAGPGTQGDVRRVVVLPRRVKDVT